MTDKEKEIQILQKHMQDLAEKSYQQNIFTFTGFLGESGQEAYFAIREKLSYVEAVFSGGNASCERKILRFGSPEQLGYEEPFPICLIRIEPLLQKFADTFSHRDFLGALMNMGIERATLGDIFLKDNTGYVFCLESMSGFIMEGLDRVGHTPVKCSLVQEQILLEKEEPDSLQITVSSVRIDALIAKIYNMSRTQSLEMFRTKCVQVNGHVCENNSAVLKEKDTVAVRGYGKFIFDGILHETRKGKQAAAIRIYQSKKQ